MIGFAAEDLTEREAPPVMPRLVSDMGADLRAESQRRWAARDLHARLGVVRNARSILAERANELADAISPRLQRTKADTMVSEVLPLLEACRFLERNAVRILRPRRLGLAGRPLWLSGVFAEVNREPLGQVLVIGPSNFPLFLPGVQVMQALVAGNGVTWKPGAGGAAVAELVAEILSAAGLPRGVLRVTGESQAEGEAEIGLGADKVVFTGSAANGRAVMETLAATATPSVMELSGADAVVVLPSADLKRVAKAVAFGLRLNGAAVCMSPRRVFATAASMRELRPLLEDELATLPSMILDQQTHDRLMRLLSSAADDGAVVKFVQTGDGVSAYIVDDAAAKMQITQSDIFAPVISLIKVSSMMHVPELHGMSPYGLTAAIFGHEDEARAMARLLRVGSVLINDLIVPTADPRVPFGGRGASGFGVTRGAEGLLEMTAVKTVLVRRSGSLRHMDATSEGQATMFAELIRMLHGGTWISRWSALRKLIRETRR